MAPWTDELEDREEEEDGANISTHAVYRRARVVKCVAYVMPCMCGCGVRSPC
jgi:hypothetical protein